jgi:hypothetical protein
MDALGINFWLLLNQLIVIVIVLVFPIITLIALARKKLASLPLAIWVLVICIIPILGPLAYWIIKPAPESR